MTNMRKDASDISVIIPVHDDATALHKCLSILAETREQCREIIVVADGCRDGSKAVAEKFDTVVINLPEPAQGPARARNIGARAAKGEILFFLDADVLLYPDTVRTIQAAFEADCDMAAVFGSYDDTPEQRNFLSQYRNLLHHYVHQHAREDASTFWAGCGAIRKDVFRAMNGFGESFIKPSIEDIELGYRMKKNGYRIRLIKNLQVTHLKKWTVGSLLYTDFALRALPWSRLIFREKMFIRDLNLKIADRVSVMYIWGILGALLLSFQRTGFLFAAGGFILLFILLNLPIYRFFVRKRGIWFVLAVIPWHGIHYGTSGAAFLIGLWDYFIKRYFKK